MREANLRCSAKFEPPSRQDNASTILARAAPKKFNSDNSQIPETFFELASSSASRSKQKVPLLDRLVEFQPDTGTSLSDYRTGQIGAVCEFKRY